MVSAKTLFPTPPRHRDPLDASSASAPSLNSDSLQAQRCLSSLQDSTARPVWGARNASAWCAGASVDGALCFAPCFAPQWTAPLHNKTPWTFLRSSWAARMRSKRSQARYRPQQARSRIPPSRHASQQTCLLPALQASAGPQPWCQQCKAQQGLCHCILLAGNGRIAHFGGSFGAAS